MKKTIGQSFIKGTFILIFANILVKIIGAIYKLPLTNLIGKEGIGIFSVAYNIYTALFVISTAGLPAAISKMVSEANALGRTREVKKIFHVALSFFSVIGAICTGVLIIFADYFTAELAGNSMAYYSVLCIAPALFFTAVASIVRGYYQGMSNMIPTAISQVIEALCKLIIGFGAAYVLLKKGFGIEIVVAGSICGVTIGTVLSAAYLCIKCIREPIIIPFDSKSFDTSTEEEILGKILKIALPITVGASVLSLTNLIDMFLVMNRLQQTGFSEESANALYGAYNMGLTIFNLPQTLIVAISVSIIPAISASYARHQFDRAAKLTESALKLASVLALPCGAGLFILSGPIMNLLYPSRPEDVQIATPLLSTLGIAVLFVGMVSLTNSILQATGKVNLPVFTMIAGGIVKLLVNYFLVGTPDINIHGAPIGTVCCYATITILNFICIIAFTDISVKYGKVLIKPFISAALMGLFAFFANPFISNLIGDKLSAVVTISASGLLYLALLIITKSISKEDMLLVPHGERIVKLLHLK